MSMASASPTPSELDAKAQVAVNSRPEDDNQSDGDQLETAFAEFMSRYGSKSSTASTAPAKPVVTQTAQPVPAVTVETEIKQAAKRQVVSSIRETEDAVRELRHVANEITRSVLESHQELLSTKLMIANLVMGLASIIVSLVATLLCPSPASPLFILAVAFYIVGVLLTTRLASEWKQYRTRGSSLRLERR